MTEEIGSAPTMNDDLRVGRQATIETLEGRFIAGTVDRVWQTENGTPICLVVDGATVPWAAIRAIRDDPAVPTDPDGVFAPLNPAPAGIGG